MDFRNIIPKLRKLSANGKSFSSSGLTLLKNEFRTEAILTATKLLPQGGTKISILENKSLFESQIKDVNLRNEAYRLDIRKDSVTLEAGSEKGAYYGLQTIRQLFKNGGEIQEALIEDWPSLKLRGFHLTLGSGHMPTFRRMKEIIRTLAAYKINMLVLEYDDRFPWKKHPALVHPDTYSLEELKELIALAEANCIEVVPLLDSLGHAEQYLCHPEYAHLKERPENIQEMCPQNPAVLEFMKDLWSEVLDIHQNSRYAHITGDEVFRMPEGFCPECSKYAKEGKLAELFTSYYSKLSEWIISKGKQPVIWGDMLLKHSENIEVFPRSMIINDWCYYGLEEPYWDFKNFEKDAEGKCDESRMQLLGKYWKGPSANEHPAYPTIRFFRDQNFKTLASTAASDENAGRFPASRLRSRFANNMSFSLAAAEADSEGLLITFWSNYTSMEGAWFGILAGADFSWNARRESFEVFAERFSINFLNERPDFMKICAENAERKKNPEIKISTAYDRESIAGRYKEFLILSNKMHSLDFALKDLNKKQISAKLNGKAFEISLKGVLNSNISNCLPPDSPGFKFPAGIMEVSGMRFKLENPDAELAYLTLCDKGKVRNAELKCRCRCEKLAIINSCHYAGKGAKVSELIFRYSDGTESVVPMIAAKNCHDWWGAPQIIPEGLAVWTGKSELQTEIFLYLSIIENPHPEKEITGIGFKSGRGLIRQVILAVNGLDSIIEMNIIEKENKLLAQIEKEIEEIKTELPALYRGIMTDTEAAIQSVPAIEVLERNLNICKSQKEALCAENALP